MARRNSVGDGTLAEAWVTADASGGFDAGVADLGTPGAREAWFVPNATDETTAETVAPPAVEIAAEPTELPAADIATEPEAAIADEPVLAESEPEEPVETIPTEPVPTIAWEAPTVEDPIADATQTSVTETETVDAVPEATEPDVATEAQTAVETEAVPIVETAETVESANAADVSATTDADAVGGAETVSVEAPTERATVAGTLVVSEFASDADEEWIEIANAGTEDASLSGWTVEDATGKATALPDQTLGAGQFVVVANPKGKLNNDGDVIALLDPSGATVDRIAYGTEEIPAPKKSESTARGADGTWHRTTTPTAGAGNVISESVAATESPVVAVESEPAAEEVEPAAATTVAEPEDEPIVETMTDESTEEAVPWSGPATLRLSELYPNTSGKDETEEFIELENVGDAAVDLAGWQLSDASGKTFAAKTGTSVAPHAFLALSRDVTKLTLNNDDDSVTLTAPDGTVVDTRSYAKAKKGSSLVLVSAEWVWSGTPTPNEPNHVPTDAPAPVAAASGNGGSLSAGTVRHAVEGTVLVAPGVLSSQTFYVATDDGGTQVYKYDGDFPELNEGDVVRISGTTTTARGEERLKVSKTDSITVIGSGEPVVAEDADIANLTERDVGKLVRVRATVVTRSGDKVTVEDGASQLTVRVADGTGIDLATLARGTKYRITGILSSASGKLALLPRSPADIELVEDPVAAAAATAAPAGLQSADARDAATATAITAGVALALVAYSARKFGPKFLHWYAKARALRAAA